MLESGFSHSQLVFNQEVTSICLRKKTLLVVKGIYHYWKYIFPGGPNQMEGEVQVNEPV